MQNSSMEVVVSQARAQYGRIPVTPTQEAVEGILFDFCDGLRIKFPESGGPWYVVFRDADTGTVMCARQAAAGEMLAGTKKYYVKYHLLIYRQEDIDACAEDAAAGLSPTQPEPIFEHVYDAKGKTVMVQSPFNTLGDTLAWFHYIEKFRVKHGCRMIAAVQPRFIDLFKGQYPDIEFITPRHTQKYAPYACYYLGLFFTEDADHQPCDFRYVGLHRTAGYILGVDPEPVAPRLDLSAPRKIAEPYVCIAVQSTSQAKYWNNPEGWMRIVKFLKDSGYRVLCIDREAEHGVGLTHNYIPFGCEDYTGDFTLQERIDLIKDADFFVGLSSGLSWLAWGCGGVPIVLISGFSHPLNEFYTPYRVINYLACNSCWNDTRCVFDNNDYFWCPRHKGTPRQFECTRLITPEQVIDAIKTIPAFKAHARS